MTFSRIIRMRREDWLALADLILDGRLPFPTREDYQEARKLAFWIGNQVREHFGATVELAFGWEPSLTVVKATALLPKQA